MSVEGSFPTNDKVHLFYEDAEASSTTDWTALGPPGPGIGNWAGLESSEGGLGYYGEFSNYGYDWEGAGIVIPDVSSPRVEESLTDFNVPPLRRLATLGNRLDGSGVVLAFQVCDNRGVVGQDSGGVVVMPSAGYENDSVDGSVQFCDPDEYPSRACGVWITQGGYVTDYDGGPVVGADLRACVATAGRANRNPEDYYDTVVFDDSDAGTAVLVDTNVTENELTEFYQGGLALRMVRVAVDTFVVVYLRDGEYRPVVINPDYPAHAWTYFHGTACARVIRTSGLSVEVGPRIELADDAMQVDIVSLGDGKAVISYSVHAASGPRWGEANWKVAQVSGMSLSLGPLYQQKPTPPPPIPPPIHVGSTFSGSTVNFGTPQDGDFLFLQASSGGGTALVLPSGWTEIVKSNGFQHNMLLARRIWRTGDPTTVTVTNASLAAVTIYRGDGPTVSASVTFNWWNSEVGGQINVPSGHNFVIDTMFNNSLSTFTPTAPAGETKRYGQVNGGHGMALADTAGYSVPAGVFNPPDWGGFNEGTGTTVGVMVSLRLFPLDTPFGDFVDPMLISHAAVISPGVCVLGYEYAYQAVSGVSVFGGVEHPFYNEDLEVKLDRVAISGLTISSLETGVDFPVTNDGIEGFSILGLPDNRMILFCEGWEGHYRTGSVYPDYTGFIVTQGHSTLFKVDDDGFRVIDRSSDDDTWISGNNAAYQFSENVAAVVEDGGTWYLEYFEGIPKNVHQTAVATLDDNWFVIHGNSAPFFTFDQQGIWDSEPFTITVGGVPNTRYGEPVRGELRSVHVDDNGIVDIVGKAFVSHWRGQFELINNRIGGANAGVVGTGVGRRFLCAYHGSNVRAGQTAIVNSFNNLYNHPAADVPDDNGPWVRLFDVADDGTVVALTDPERLPVGVRTPGVNDNIGLDVTTMFVWTPMSSGVFLLTYQGLVNGADALLTRTVLVEGEELSFGTETVVASLPLDLRNRNTRMTGPDAVFYHVNNVQWAWQPPFLMDRISDTVAVMVCLNRTQGELFPPEVQAISSNYVGVHYWNLFYIARAVEVSGTTLRLGPMIEPPDYLFGSGDHVQPYRAVVGDSLLVPFTNYRRSVYTHEGQVEADAHTPTQTFPNETYEGQLMFVALRPSYDLTLEVTLAAPQINIGNEDYPDTWVEYMYGPMIVLDDKNFLWIGEIQTDPQGKPSDLYDAINFPLGDGMFMHRWTIGDDGSFALKPEIDYFDFEGDPWPLPQWATGSKWTLVAWGGGQRWGDPGYPLSGRSATGGSYGGGPIWGRVIGLAPLVEPRGVLSLGDQRVKVRGRAAG